MPRIYTSANDPLDFCNKHFPTEAIAIELFGNVGDGPDNRGNCFEYNADHPPYELEDYECETCKTPLGWQDDDPSSSPLPEWQ